jgi:hypothetical protein
MLHISIPIALAVGGEGISNAMFDLCSMIVQVQWNFGIYRFLLFLCVYIMGIHNYVGRLFLFLSSSQQMYKKNKWNFWVWNVGPNIKRPNDLRGTDLKGHYVQKGPAWRATMLKRDRSEGS